MEEDERTYHWVDQAARTIIKEKGNKEKYVLASGATPDQIIHIGNFRELITTDLVFRSLKHMGKTVDFLHFWDDYDVFNKVPEESPQKRMLAKHLGKALCNVPDPNGEELSYAEYFEKKFEASLDKVGVDPTFVYQFKEYREGAYVKEIQKALDETQTIKTIINQYRKKPLEDDWLPVSVFCEACQNSDVKMEYLGEGRISYKCEECQYKSTFEVSKTRNIKLRWRIDWPMRWHAKKIDFEPGGKNHFTNGGSFDTGKAIVNEVYGSEPPCHVFYEYISIKGMGKKVLPSKGRPITLDEVLEVYEPEVLRWIFTSYKPNADFTISFDLDVIKIYEDYDRAEKVYFGEGDAFENKKPTIKRAYELAQIWDIPKRKPYQPLFRQLCNFIQIYDFDFERVKNRLKNNIRDEIDEQKLKNRYDCASFWIKNYAPEDFKFSVLEKRPSPINFSQTELKLLKNVKDFLKNNLDATEEVLSDALFEAVRVVDLQQKEGFKVFYACLIGRTVGPNLAHLMNAIGYEKVLKLIDF